MNRVMIWATALLLVVAGMAVSAPEAEAGLFNRNDCCKPQRQSRACRRAARKSSCCEPAPCCAPEPTCCEAAPACGCDAAPACGCSAAVATPAPCGCEAAAPACGCEAAAPACGCQTANCDCLNRRQLRRANRKGECCGVAANTCNSCAVQTVSYETAAPACGCSAPVQGCSTCGGAQTIESAPPTPAAGEEAAPEAPEAGATT